MSKRPSNIIIKVFISIAAVFGFFVLGNWLIKIQRNENIRGDGVGNISQENFEIASQILPFEILKDDSRPFGL
ncbi:hypothetical protein IQ241_02030 [Romeria aff. gracilis LEGE 07310]|uniref:Uncharacterized protein n=1 Tax=Vasconcelosia minhoensis LEGE 07310 TaxID=915328 RepID=A0A8J7A4H9_9CYAN|nr:hypothetical protein [Romeria gracilis]MBE9076082.1 hypothetical protein [Romeria aff. gracilis LEGE 07310]